MAENECAANASSEEANRAATIRIKEDCVRMQENDVASQLKNVEAENVKATVVIGIVGAMASLIPASQMDDLLKAILVVAFLLPLGISLYNITSKEVYSHMGVDDAFVNPSHNYEGYLNACHMALNRNYTSISKLLTIKRILTGMSYLATIFLVIVTLFIKLK